VLKVQVLLYEHVNAIGRRVKVKHDTLLFKPEAMSSRAHHLFYLLVESLLYVDIWSIYLKGVLADVAQGLQTFAQLHITPPTLDTISCTHFDDLVDG